MTVSFGKGCLKLLKRYCVLCTKYKVYHFVLTIKVASTKITSTQYKVLRTKKYESSIIKVVPSLLNSGLIISDMSDHLPTVIKLSNGKQDIKHQQTVTYRKINEENIRLINEDLKGYNWEEILETTGTDETFQILHETLIMSMNKHMPLETKKLTKKDTCNEPWITKGIEKCINKQRQLYKKSIGNKATDKDHKKYKEYRGMLQKVKRKAIMDYYQEKCTKYKNETRKLWNVINTITGKKFNRDTMIESLKIE